MATYEIVTEKGTYQVDTEEQKKKTPSVREAVLPKLRETEEKIVSRRDPVEVLQEELQTPFAGIQHPLATLMKPAVTALKTVAVPIGRLEAALAGGGLAAQRGEFSQILPDMLQGVTGQKQAQLGDIVRTTGMGGGLNEPLAALTGFGGMAGVMNIATSGRLSKAATLKNDKVAGNVINSLIKPSHKEFMFGKNPGQAVAKEGLMATSLEGLAGKVSGRIDEIKKVISVIRSTTENINKSVNLSNIRQPLVNLLKQLKRTPKTNAQEIAGVGDAIDDITNLITEIDKVGLNRVSVSQAYQIKDAISKMQKWNRESSLGTYLNKGLKQTYNKIDDAIDIVIPELKELNSRMSNLISAGQAIAHRVEILSKQEGFPTLMKLLDLPFMAFKTVGAKTLLGRLLAKQYKLVSK